VKLVIISALSWIRSFNREHGGIL